MKSRFFYLFSLCLTILCSCQNDEKTPTKTVTNSISRPENPKEPNFDYKIQHPKGWATYDTIIQDVKYRYMLAPDSLDYERPRVNIIIVSMEGREIDDFTARNMNYLKANMQGTILLEKDTINISSTSARWFTYTKEQNGVVRDMINYIIPVRGFAYMITCGTNIGSMKKYRLIFDQIARSFRA